jgi:hypothetical protein
MARSRQKSECGLTAICRATTKCVKLENVLLPQEVTRIWIKYISGGRTDTFIWTYRYTNHDAVSEST